MLKMTSHTLAAALLVGLTATPALAQEVVVKMKVDTKVIQDTVQDVVRDIRDSVRSSMGPDFRQELRHAAREIAEAFGDLGNFTWDADTWGQGQSQRFRATQTDRETRRFNIGATGQLDLETLSGDVTVRRGSGRELVVEIIRESRGATDAAARTGLAEVKAVSEERGGRVTIKTVYPNQRRGTQQHSVSVSYVVSAPAGTRISTHSLSGDVSIEGIDGELSVNTMSGDVVITDAARLTSAKTLSGDLTLTNVAAEGLLEASTMSGEIVAAGVKARRVDLGAVAGGVSARNVQAEEVKLGSMSDDVVFEGSLTPRGRYEFTSHSGDVSITLVGQTGFSFDASTFSGSVRSDVALQGSRTAARGVGSRRSDTRSLNGTFGDGSAVIEARSFSGSVVVTRK
jgi:DUF4097 and DUF4098 domain-containing protein YvlB